MLVFVIGSSCCDFCHYFCSLLLLLVAQYVACCSCCFSCGSFLLYSELATRFHRYVPEIITATRENKMCLTKKITFCFLWPNDDLWSGDADAGCFSGKKKLFNALKIAEYVFFSFCGVRSTHVHGRSNLPRCCGQHRFHLRRTLQLAHRGGVIINCSCKEVQVEQEH